MGKRNWSVVGVLLIWGTTTLPRCLAILGTPYNGTKLSDSQPESDFGPLEII